MFVYLQNTAHKVITQHVQGLTDTVDSPVNPLNQMGARAKRNSPNPRASPRYVKCMAAGVYLFPILQHRLKKKNSGPVWVRAETKKSKLSSSVGQDTLLLILQSYSITGTCRLYVQCERL